MQEPQIGHKNPIFRIVGKSNGAYPTTSGWTGNKNPIVNGKHYYHRLFIKRIGWETYLGLDDDGYELWDVVLDNADDDDYKWFMSRNKDKKD